jgi:hypothetical protein
MMCYVSRYILYKIEMLPDRIVIHYPFKSKSYKTGTLRKFVIGGDWPYRDLELHFEGCKKIRLLAPAKLDDFEMEIMNYLPENEKEQEPGNE